MRPAQTSRALHVLTRLLGASAFGLALVAADAALAPAALAAPTVSTSSTTLGTTALLTNPRTKQRAAKATSPHDDVRPEPGTGGTAEA